MLDFRPLDNWLEIVERLQEFIVDSVRAHGSQGALLGISGGIDSAVVAALATRALGPEKVHACLLPDMDSDADTLKDARHVVDWLGIADVYERDITKLLDELGTYKLFADLYALPRKERLEHVAQRKKLIIEQNGDHKFLASYRQRVNEEMNRIRAFWNSKIRTRMVILYTQAELKKLTVLGTTNKSEYLTGWFTKYGDGAVDVEVILPLYKTRVYELARYLGVPDAICQKVPTGDILPGVADEDMLGVRYSVLDPILLGLERRLLHEDIAATLNIDQSIVRRVASLIETSQFSRVNPLVPDFAVD